MEYYLIIKDMSNKFNYRLRMVEYALKYGKSQAARECKTTRKTVRKWVERFRQEGLEGLKDKKKAPKHIPHKLKPEDETQDSGVKAETPFLGFKAFN